MKIKMSQTGKFYEQGKSLSPTDELEIASLIIINRSKSEIKKRTGRSKKAIKRVREMVERNEDLFEKRNIGRPSETGEHTAPYRLDYLLNLIMRYPVTDLDKLKAAYDAAFNCNISWSMMHYVITKHLKFVWKHTTKVEYAQTMPQIQKLRKEF